MQKNSNIADKKDLALSRGGLYEAFALGFRTPTPETVERLCTDRQNHALKELVLILETAQSSGLVNMIAHLPACSDAMSLTTLDESYQYLFGHTAHSVVPPYETEYGSDTLFQQPQQLSDLSGFYNAFGLQLNKTEHERADHISCESEFLAFLNLKEAYALEKNDQDMLAETRKAYRLFLRDHLGRFVPAFATLLIRQHPKSFYSALGKLVKEFVVVECQRLKIQAGPENLRLRPKVTADDCLTCGAGQELIKEIAKQES